MRVNRPLLRTAAAIHQALTRRDRLRPAIDLPEASWQDCARLARQCRRAEGRGLHLAASRLGRDYRAALDRLAVEVHSATRRYDDLHRAVSIATTADIYRDLLALNEEFDDVSANRKTKILTATTEPIELDGIFLGPFEIRLNWGDVASGRPSPYRVVALDPHPAATNESVTHPHVQDEMICEGDGLQPIRQALAQGRVLDFFLIVNNLLATYNAESPYVALADWYGMECADCGSSVSEDERYRCEKCSTVICGECTVSCQGCEDVFCVECVSSCPGCEQDFCTGCLRSCAGCRRRLCSSCFDDQERCDDCYEAECEESTKDEPIVEHISSGDTRAPLHPHRVGEAAVSA